MCFIKIENVYPAKNKKSSLEFSSFLYEILYNKEFKSKDELCFFIKEKTGFSAKVILSEHLNINSFICDILNKNYKEKIVVSTKRGSVVIIALFKKD